MIIVFISCTDRYSFINVIIIIIILISSNSFLSMFKDFNLDQNS